LLLALYTNVMARIKAIQNEGGATAAEYGLLLALIAAVIFGVIGTLGDEILEAFQAVIDGFNS